MSESSRELPKPVLLFFCLYLLLFLILFGLHSILKPTFDFVNHLGLPPFLSEPIGTMLVWGIWVPIVCSPVLFGLVAKCNLMRWTITGGVSISAIAAFGIVVWRFSSFSIIRFLDGFLLYATLFGGTTLLLGVAVFVFRKLFGKLSSVNQTL